MGALDRSMASAVLNALAPVGALGVPGAMIPALGALGMKVRLHSTLSTAAAAGTELTGLGYTAGGTSLAVASPASVNGSNVTLPHVTPLTWTNLSGAPWTIASVEITDSAGLRVWYGPVTGQPVTVGIGNAYQFAADGIVLQAA